MTFDSRDVVIVDYARTPMGRSKNGCFRHQRADTLSAHLMRSLIDRVEVLDADEIDDVIWGCVMQRGEQAFNIARNSLLLAGLPHSVPGQTINRLCGSSMSALHMAYANIRAALGDVYLVGGVEHMGHIDMMADVDPNPLLTRSVAKAAGSMGLTAEYLATLHNISREDMDAFALRSHTLAHKATLDGVFDQEIVPTEGHDSDGAKVMVFKDETIRPESTLDMLASLPPVFNPKGGTVTAGSSSQITDGASAMLVMSYEKACELDIEPLARIASVGIAGVEPSVMGMGPVPATEKALSALDLTVDDMSLIELNEAFAAQSLAVLDEWYLTDEIENKVNIYGGAIALGHPFGCSGTRITGTLLTAMANRNVQWGLSTMCIGLGQGISTVIERIKNK